MGEFTALFPFGGSGGGALGFLDAEARLLGAVGAFRCLGSLDFDAVACRDFERFTGAPAWCVDVQDVTAAELHARYGRTAPDVVFMSPPCKGSSRLLSSAKARTDKYRDMNRLAVVWTRVMLEAWGDDPPALLLLENVPGLPARAKGMITELREMLAAVGYVFHASDHDCGEVGGLAQHRRRYLLVARHPGKCPPLLYQPPKRRVRGVGEVLSLLPMPATLAAAEWGKLHTMPRLSWRNWLRLALIPAGGDWRDLAGVLEGRARREVFRRHAVQAWDQPHPAVTGPGGHSVEAVADTRVALPEGTEWNNGAMGVRDWTAPSGTVTGGAHPSKGTFSVADTRVAMDKPGWGGGAFGVTEWDAPSGTVAAENMPSNGRYSVADPRLGFGDRQADRSRSEQRPGWYGVLGWDEPARTVAGTANVGTGAYSVADARTGWAEGVRVLTLDEAMALELDPAKPPPFVPVIVAEDGTWHRPMTLLELAALQGLPLRVNGKPLQLSGTRTQQATHIGNAVPVGAAHAIATRMLVALLEADGAGWSLAGGDTPVWVDGPSAEAAE